MKNSHKWALLCERSKYDSHYHLYTLLFLQLIGSELLDKPSAMGPDGRAKRHWLDSQPNRNFSLVTFTLLH